MDDERTAAPEQGGTQPAEPVLLPPLRRDRLLTSLTGEEISRRFAPPVSDHTAPARPLVKRTYELEETVVSGVRRQAVILGVNANDLANALLKDGLQALSTGALEASIGILPEDHVRGPRAAGRYITELRHRHGPSEPPTAGDATTGGG